MIGKDLLCEYFSYLGEPEDILHAGRVCKEWSSSIDNPVAWIGRTKINEEFIHSKYFKYLRVIDFPIYRLHKKKFC